MNILVVSQYYYPEQFRINDICETLTKDGHHVTVLTGLPNYNTGNVPQEYRFFRKRRESISGVNVIRCSLLGRGKSKLKLFMNYMTFTLSSSLKALFLGSKYDVVYIYQLSPISMCVSALIYKTIYKKKVHLYCLDLWPESIVAASVSRNSLLYKVLLKFSQFIYNNVDQLSVTSYSFIDYLKHTIGLHNKSIEFVPQYAESLYSNSIAVSPKSTIDLMFAGNIGEMQSVETIIHAAKKLENHDRLMWHIVGDGAAKQRCEQLVSELSLGNKVVFYGHLPVDEMPRLFSMATAMLVTMKGDEALSRTLPGKVQSYMAAGKPIIGAINGETKRVIEAAQCGFCAEADDASGLAREVERFITLETEHHQIGLNARNYYEDNFTKEKFMTRLTSMLTDISKGRRANV